MTYTDFQYLKLLFPTILRQSFRDFEVIVLDNGQNVSVQEYVTSLQAECHERIMYVSNTKGDEGYPGGNVSAVRYAKGEYVMILNPDTLLEKQTIEFLVQEFSKQSKEVMVLVPKILIRRTDIINSMGMRRVRPSENIYTNIGYLERDVGQYDAPQRVDAFDGSALMFRRQLLQHTYLFDPRFFFGNETVDLAERMSKLGFYARTCPRAVVRHFLRGTVASSKQNDRYAAIIVRNALIHTLRNTDRGMFFRTLIIGMCVRNIFGRLITGQNRRMAIPYLKGVLMFIKQLGEFANPPFLSKQSS